MDSAGRSAGDAGGAGRVGETLGSDIKPDWSDDSRRPKQLLNIEI
jgi:hypothetical protein